MKNALIILDPQETTRKLAYSLWCQKGKPLNNDPISDWVEAEKYNMPVFTNLSSSLSKTA